MLPRTWEPIKPAERKESMAANVEREVQERRRRERLAASLRENLKRRKAQQRGRASQGPPESDGEPSSGAMGAVRD